MDISYDFRKILDAYPEHNTCVGIAKTVAGIPRPCGNCLNTSNQSIAERILTEMNKEKSASLKNIEDLASVMLCPHQHNNNSKPYLCQVDEVCVKWEAKVKDHQRAVEKEQAKSAAMMKRQELSKLKRNAEEIMVKINGEDREQMEFMRRSVPEAKELKQSQKDIHIKAVSKPKDPFISHRHSSSTPRGSFCVFPPNYVKSTQSRENIGKLSSSTRVEAKIVKERETWCLPIQHPNPPSPPTTPVSLRQGTEKKTAGSPPLIKREHIAHQVQTLTTPTMTPLRTQERRRALSSPTKPTKFVPPTMNNLPDTPESNKSNDLELSASLQGPLPTFDFNFISQLPIPTPISKSELVYPAEANTKRLSAFEFGSEYKVSPKSFELKEKADASFAITLPKKASWDDFFTSMAADSKTIQGTINDISNTSPLQTSKMCNQEMKMVAGAEEVVPTRTQTPPRARTPPRQNIISQISSPPSTPPSRPLPAIPSNPSLRSLKTSSPTTVLHISPMTPVPSQAQDLPQSPAQRRSPKSPQRRPSKRMSALLDTLPPLPLPLPNAPFASSNSNNRGSEFGYANITPTAMRYKTFLPAAQKRLKREPSDPLPKLEIFTGPFDLTLRVPKEVVEVKKCVPLRSIPRKPVPRRDETLEMSGGLTDEHVKMERGPIARFREERNVLPGKISERNGEILQGEEEKNGLGCFGMRRMRKRMGRQMEGLRETMTRLEMKRIKELEKS
ncbi:hypothetical protein B0O99DRAFT_249789 [Bisporella sp. PMI_857]|nr:hypothetical protein B0O99DRAFT_249789 [Bisporella sp. PMI_857]